MAFFRYANAKVVHPQVSKTQWMNVRTAAKKVATEDGEIAPSLIQRASEFLGAEFSPKRYLLTHATIIASVDVSSPPGVKTGSIMEDGFRVMRKYSDFRVTTETDKYINNNFDAWSRGVLLKAFQTFIGGHNFLEHVQIEDLSKGRIIDAVARDVGDSIYVDILIATDRRHKDLVKAIESGKMGTLSMGCTVDFTICTKCGHVAADETEMCPHVKYKKGNLFFDEQGQKNRVAELCGHESLDPTGGVTFIEASWVETPAFTGAVMRNVLEPSVQMSQQIQKVLASTPPQWLEDATAKAASMDGVITRNFQNPTRTQFRTSDFIAGDVFLAGWLEDDGGSEEPEGEPAETAPEEEPTETAPEETTPAETPTSPLKDMEDEVYKDVLEKLKQRLKDDMQQPSTEEPHTPSESTNENLNHQAAVRAYQAGLQVVCRTASSDVALVDGVAQFNQQLGVDVPVLLYRVALKVGDPAEHGSSQAYRKACRTAMERKPTSRESLVLARLGQLLFRRGSLEGGYDGKRHGGDGS